MWFFYLIEIRDINNLLIANIRIYLTGKFLSGWLSIKCF